MYMYNAYSYMFTCVYIHSPSFPRHFLSSDASSSVRVAWPLSSTPRSLRTWPTKPAAACPHRHGSMTNNLPLLRFGLQTIIRGVGKSFLCISSIRLGFGVGPILTLATSRKDPTPRCLELAQISVLAESPQGHPNPPRSRCLAQGE